APAEILIGDVLDLPSLEPAVAGCEAVIHTAANLSFRRADFAAQRQVNVEGTRNVLRAARAAQVRRFVHASSGSALARPRPGCVGDETTPYDWPIGFNYNETKRDAEALVFGATGLEAVCLNPALVFGPGEVSRHTLPLFRAVARGLIRLAPPGGTTLCDV